MRKESFCILLALSAALVPRFDALAQDAVHVGQPVPSASIGSVAAKQSFSYASTILAADNGALLHCPLQKMDARATTTGLWIASTAANSQNDCFRLTATELMRGNKPVPAPGNQSAISLSLTGTVHIADSVVRWRRPAITEEYSVSLDGVRQDFVIERRLPGQGRLLLELTLSGARAETAPDGAKLILPTSGRALVYNRIHATDAAGQTLSAGIQTLSTDHLELWIDDQNATYPVRIDPTFSDANWVSMGALPGVVGAVDAIVEDPSTGLLYIGGGFSVVGPVVATNVAQWNGSSWSQVGSGLGGQVRALAVDGLGNLYAGGNFTNTAIAATNVAKWNGSSWSGLGSGLTPQVIALVADGSGNLYAGGTFTNRTILATNIAQWNGSSWVSMAGGMNSTVDALVFDDFGTLFAGGFFTVAGGVSATRIAQWSGSSWSPVGGGMSGGVEALHCDPSTSFIYAGGAFGTAGGVTVDGVAVWNGGSWSALGGGVSNTVLSLAMDSSGNLYAGGFFTGASGVTANHIAVWNGSAWSPLGAGINNINVLALGVDSGGNLYVGGQFSEAGNVDVMNFARWNGSAWSAIANGLNFIPIAATVDSANNLYIGGEFSSVNGVIVSNIAEWNGANWSPLGAGIIGGPGTAVQSLTADNLGNIYAGGSFTNAGGITASNIARWNGTSWSTLGSGMSGSGGSVVGLISDHAGNLYAGGFFTNAGGVLATRIAKWNGTNWSALGSGATGPNNPNVDTFAFDQAGNLYAAGSFNSIGGVAANSIAEWNGTNWSSLGTGVGGEPFGATVSSILMNSANRLYVGGQFTTASALSATNIAVWDGTNWSALGSGLSSNVNAMAFDPEGNLYAGGNFTSAGGIPANRIAKWDGANWSALGSGLNNFPLCLAADRAGRLYAGGEFTIAGTNGSSFIVQANVLNFISSFHKNPDGSVAFNVLSTPNTTNRVLASTNLGTAAAWQPLYTNTAPANGAWQFTDPAAPLHPARFYRSSTP